MRNNTRDNNYNNLRNFDAVHNHKSLIVQNEQFTADCFGKLNMKRGYVYER